jgi:hypothetical protein
VEEEENGPVRDLAIVPARFSLPRLAKASRFSSRLRVKSFLVVSASETMNMNMNMNMDTSINMDININRIRS